MTSADLESWDEPAATGAFPINADLQTVTFAKPVVAHFLKLVAKSSVDSTAPYAAMAELNIIFAE